MQLMRRFDRQNNTKLDKKIDEELDQNHQEATHYNSMHKLKPNIVINTENINLSEENL